jgi:hypothetical protein
MADIHGRVAKTDDSKNHSQGFDQALEVALQDASKHFDKGKHTMRVEFIVEVDVVNPGIIQSYNISLVRDTQ